MMRMTMMTIRGRRGKGENEQVDKEEEEDGKVAITK